MAAILPEHDVPAPTPTPSLHNPPSRPNLTTNPAPTTNPVTTQKPKLKRFRFTDQYDLFLVKAIRCTNAHIPDWGKTEGLYEEVRKLFIPEIPPTVFTHCQEPSGKTLCDRFKRLVARRRDDVKRNNAASGIVEEYGEREVLLDDLILEMDEKDEATRLEKDEMKESEKKLIAAGEQIRDRALKRKKCSEGGTDTPDTMEGASNSSKKRCRRKEVSHSDDEITSSMLEQAALRREMEETRLNLEQDRIEIERGRAEKEAERFEKMHETTTRRLDLDEKRFEVEVEERKQSLNERKKMVDVMEMLCRKLQ